jgi:hypothetical protein
MSIRFKGVIGCEEAMHEHGRSHTKRKSADGADFLCLNADSADSSGMPAASRGEGCSGYFFSGGADWLP